MSSSLAPSGNRPLEQLKVAELREELKKRGLNLKGVKKELFERLEEAIQKEGELGFHRDSAAGEVQRVSPEGIHGTADSDGEGEDFDKLAEEVPFTDPDTVMKSQSDGMVSDSPGMPVVSVETGSRATELDPGFQETEPQGMSGVIMEASQANESDPALLGREPPKGTDIVDCGSDGIVSDEGGCVKSSLTDVAANIGTCVQDYVDNEDGSGVNSDVSELRSQHPENFCGETETLIEEAEHNVVDPKVGQPVAEVAPSVQTSDQLESSKTPQDVEVSEGFNIGNIDLKFEELGKLTGATAPAGSQHMLDPLDGCEASEKNCLPGPNYPTDVKPEPEELETHLETTHIYVDNVKDEQMDFKELSPNPEISRNPQFEIEEHASQVKREVSDNSQYEKFDHEKSSTDSVRGQRIDHEKSSSDSVRGQRIKEEEQGRHGAVAGEPIKEWAEDTKVSLKSSDANTQEHAGQKRKDDDRDIKQQEPTKRQRRWNSGNKPAGELSKPLTTGTVKEIMSLENKEGPPTLDVPPKASTPKILATSRPTPLAIKVEWFGNGEKGKERVVPPPARPPTNSLKIERFIRPFTLKAVNDLLSRYGRCAEFWMDQIKTHCYVTYSSVDEAVAARNALYDLQWPPSFGNQLVVEFVDPFEVKTRCEVSSEKAVVTPVTTPRGGVPHPSPTQAALPALPMHAQTVPLPPPPPLRERPILPPKKEPEPPIPTLDDLFKKTKAKPHIYYLPLTDDQVAVKVAVRSKEQLPKNYISSAKA